MKPVLFVFVLILGIPLVVISPTSASTLGAQGTAGPYAIATLLPAVGADIRSPNGAGVGPSGKALFYKVGDAANSTRVVIQLEGMPPALQLTADIVSGSCQGDFISTLGNMTIDSSGKARATFMLTGQQAVLGQWYVEIQLCDQLNPDQFCKVCGRVDGIGHQTVGQTSSGTGSTGSLPATGSSSLENIVISLLLAAGLLLAIGTYLRLSQTYRDLDD